MTSETCSERCGPGRPTGTQDKARGNGRGEPRSSTGMRGSRHGQHRVRRRGVGRPRKRLLLRRRSGRGDSVVFSTPRCRPGDAGPAVGDLRRSGTRLTVHVADEYNQPGPSGTVPYWTVSDVDATVRQWSEQGASAHRGPKTIMTGERLCQMLDPSATYPGCASHRPDRPVRRSKVRQGAARAHLAVKIRNRERSAAGHGVDQAALRIRRAPHDRPPEPERRRGVIETGLRA
jgi:hypothetical protein